MITVTILVGNPLAKKKKKKLSFGFNLWHRSDLFSIFYFFT